MMILGRSGLALLALAAFAVMLADRLIRQIAQDRRMRFEALHAAAFSLLVDEQPAEPGSRIETLLARIAVLLGADRAWLMTSEGSDGFYGWSQNDIVTRESAMAAASRITGRFQWDGNTIIVAPDDRAAVAWTDCLARRRATATSALLLRSQKQDDLALLCVSQWIGAEGSPRKRCMVWLRR